jgi:hypothetical protein
VIKVSNIRVRSFDLGYLDVYWDVSPCFEDLGDYTFVVERADNETGPYHALTVPLLNRYHFRDTTVRGRHSFYSRIYYRVRVSHRETGDESVWPSIGGSHLSALPDLAALEMAKLYTLRLKEFMGRKLWVYPKKRSGQRCQACYDRVTGRKMRSSCSVCFDTTWVGGFYAPVVTYGQIVSPNETVIHAGFGDAEVENTTLFAGNYPELSEGDLVVEAENKRWRVGPIIGKVTKGRALIRQQAPVHAIPKGDIEYTVPLNLTQEEVRDLLASPARNYTNPRTLESDNLAAALGDVFGKRE